MKRALVLLVLAGISLLLPACGGGNPSGRGNLRVSVTGLPAGVNAAVTISGPDSYSQTLTGSETFSGLKPGTYTVTASQVVSSGSVYAATITGSPAAVSAGQTAIVTVSYKRASGTGSLFVSVSNVPEGATPSIMVSGPHGYSKTLSQSATLSNLVPGSYTITADSVNVGGKAYQPSIDGSPAKVEAGNTATVRVSYAVNVGNLNVTISGLPAGVDAKVTVNGPGGYSKALTTTTTLTGLTPGSYAVSAEGVTVGNDSYTATVSSSPAEVNTNRTTGVTVSYQTTTGDLAVEIGGLPAGAEASVTVSGPNGFSQKLTTTQTLSGLTPGGYTVSADTVTVSGTTYDPDVLDSPAAVQAGAAATITVTYNPPNTGSLRVDITGLPAGANADVTVTAPNNFSQTLDSSTALSNLTPGDYVITAKNVTTDGNVYIPTVSGSPASVQAGRTVAATVSYAASTGNLEVTISGLPGGTAANVTVTGPNGFNQLLTASQTLSGLTLGAYTIIAGNVTVSGETYSGTVADSPATVPAGATAHSSVTYAQVTGDLTVTISGLPDGTDANVTVSGPGSYTQTLTASQTLTGLTPGSYTVTADNVTVKGDVGEDPYTGMVSDSPVTVQEGHTPSVSVSYTTTTGDLNVTIGGLPEGTDADVTVTGPNGYSQRLTTSQTLSGLAPGDYQVSANSVLVGIATYYAPTVIGSPATVSAGRFTDASVAYSLPSTSSLSVTKSGSGLGTVSSNPEGIDCGDTCSATFDEGTSVTLTATPDTGATFVGWGGACSGTESCTLTMNSDESVTATFNDTQNPTVTIQSPEDGATVTTTSVTVTGSTQDNMGVTAVAYALNGDSRQDCTGTSSFTCQVANLASGSSITVYADDGAGNEGSATVHITVSAPPPPPPPADPFDITLNFVSSISDSQRQVFQDAAARWGEVVTHGLPDISVSIPAGECGTSGFPKSDINEVVDDMLIDVSVVPIDGVGGILGQGGPCWIRSSDSLTVYGFMQFDAADLDNLEQQGALEEVVLHEMGHVLGIGTLWNFNRALLTGKGTDNPRFIGANAVREWHTLGGTGNVPVENCIGTPNDATCGTGTRDAHWRYAVFYNELMTGWTVIGIANPLSRMTIGSLQDLGYQVNYDAADPYSLPSPSSIIAQSEQQAVPLNFILVKPRGSVP